MDDEQPDEPKPDGKTGDRREKDAPAPERSRIQPDTTPVRERRDNLRRRGEWFRKRRSGSDAG